ncbi:hypothetical protein FB03_03255 [Actinotignum schaalii]|nr:hypothetical protein FB03_03255 [Actinotignum schaalii]
MTSKTATGQYLLILPGDQVLHIRRSGFTPSRTYNDTILGHPRENRKDILKIFTAAPAPNRNGARRYPASAGTLRQ